MTRWTSSRAIRVRTTSRTATISATNRTGFAGRRSTTPVPSVPSSSIPEHVPEDASIQLHVDGEVRQDSSITEFIFSVPELIEEITTYMTLEAGDVIVTGTPAGVGPLEDGNTVEVEVEGIPTLEHDVRSA